MTVRIRLEAADVTELDATETALRSVLTVASNSRDYPNRRRGGDPGDPGRRRYLESTGTRTTPAGAPAGERSPVAAAEDFKRSRDLLGEIGALRAADADLEARPWFPLRPGDVVLMSLEADAYCPAYGETYLAVDGRTDIAGNAMLRQVSRTCDDAGASDEPDVLLRYDTGADRWVLDTYQLYPADSGTGWLQHDADAPPDIHPDQVHAAQDWAGDRVTRFLQLAESGDEVTGWCEHPRGWVPVVNGQPPQQPRQEPLTPFYNLWFEAGPTRLTIIRAGALVHGRPTTATPATAGKGR